MLFSWGPSDVDDDIESLIKRGKKNGNESKVVVNVGFLLFSSLRMYGVFETKRKRKIRVEYFWEIHFFEFFLFRFSFS